MKAMLFERLIDRRDRVKIRKRTRKYHKPYDYRMHFLDMPEKDACSFLVVGDSGSGDFNDLMKYYVADEMNKEVDFDLILHTGDVVYLSGSRQGYPDRFIKPYRHWLLKGEQHSYRNMIFTKPFLPIYGNHDYYDFAKLLPGLGKLVGLLSDSIGTGSKTGKVFEHAFVENNKRRLKKDSLPYHPGHHTRIPNRYYWYTHGPCAFYALDSNTLDIVHAPDRKEKDKIRLEIEKIENDILRGRKGIEHFAALEAKGELTPELRTAFEVFFYQLAQKEKKAALLEKRLKANSADHDTAQLAWLERVLQHQDAADKWKIVYLHHSLYSSEGGHVDDIATGGLRENLRRILAKHKVNLVLSGHSHCFEWAMRRAASPHASAEIQQLAKAERNICYIVTGGGGQKLRASVLEDFRADGDVKEKQDMFLKVAQSKAYTATFSEMETAEQFANIHNYVRIEADQNTLKVIPRGVGVLHQQSHRLPDFYTKVFTKKGMLIEAQIKNLKAVHVFKGKPAEAEWVRNTKV